MEKLVILCVKNITITGEPLVLPYRDMSCTYCKRVIQVLL